MHGKSNLFSVDLFFVFFSCDRGDQTSFQKCKVSAYGSLSKGSARIWLINAQGSEHAWSTVLNIPGLRIWEGCEYVSVTLGVEYA